MCSRTGGPVGGGIHPPTVHSFNSPCCTAGLWFTKPQRERAVEFSALEMKARQENFRLVVQNENGQVCASQSRSFTLVFLWSLVVLVDSAQLRPPEGKSLKSHEMNANTTSTVTQTGKDYGQFTTTSTRCCFFSPHKEITLRRFCLQAVPSIVR